MPYLSIKNIRKMNPPRNPSPIRGIGGGFSATTTAYGTIGNVAWTVGALYNTKIISGLLFK